MAPKLTAVSFCYSHKLAGWLSSVFVSPGSISISVLKFSESIKLFGIIPGIIYDFSSVPLSTCIKKANKIADHVRSTWSRILPAIYARM